MLGTNVRIITRLHLHHIEFPLVGPVPLPFPFLFAFPTVLYCTGPYTAMHSHDGSMSIITAIIL